MVWVIVVIAIVVVIAAVAYFVVRSRRVEAQREELREHRELARRQEREADEREQAARADAEAAVEREREAEAELARAREERQEVVSTASDEIDRSERQRIAAETRHSQADELEERVGPADEDGS